MKNIIVRNLSAPKLPNARALEEVANAIKAQRFSSSATCIQGDISIWYKTGAIEMYDVKINKEVKS